MKIASTIARYLLGIIFFAFGLNGFLQFLHMPPPTGIAAQFMGALFVSHYLVVVFLLELIPGNPASDQSATCRWRWSCSGP